MGERRLARLGGSVELRVKRSFLEIHPETPPEGRPISSLGYPPERWAQLTANLARMGKEDNIAFIERTFTANSHKALLLAEAATEAGSDRFEALNEALFRAYFGDGKNIGDVDVIRRIADETCIPRDIVESAWTDPRYEEGLKRANAAASRIGITAIPTFIIADKWMIEGAVPLDMMRKVVREADVAS